MTATMADVARLAGVSTTTVSHVINGTRPVSVATVERVHRAIERTGYMQNSIARALAGARTQSIGLAISSISNPYFMDVIAGIEAECSRAGYTLLLADTHEEPRHELAVVQMLEQRRVDGLILAPSARADEHVVPYLAGRSLPVVGLDRFVDADLDQVGVENEEPTALLVDHLASLGHRRIAMVAGLRGLSTTDERLSGYRKGLARNDLPFEEELVAQGASSRNPAHDAVGRLLEQRQRPTAIVTGNNYMTIGTLQALREHSMVVPDDVALVAFDDFEWADLFRPRLTTMAQPTRELGARAVQLLLHRLEEPDSPRRQVQLHASFMHRESCGCVNGAAPPSTQTARLE